MRALAGGVTVSAICLTLLESVVLPGCNAVLSVFSSSAGCVFENLGSGRDQRLGRLDDGVALAFGNDGPGFAQDHFVGFLVGDPQRLSFLEFALPHAARSRALARGP